jgi:hypothetical protein
VRTSNHLNSLGMCSVYCPEANFLPLGSEGKGKLYSLEVEHLESERASTILFTSLLQCSEYLEGTENHQFINKSELLVT